MTRVIGTSRMKTTMSARPARQRRTDSYPGFHQTHCSVISNHLLDGSYPGRRVRQIELQLFRTEKSNDVQGIMQMHDEWSNRPWDTAWSST